MTTGLCAGCNPTSWAIDSPPSSQCDPFTTINPIPWLRDSSFLPSVPNRAGGFFIPTRNANMTTIQIKHRYTNALLFKCEAPEELESGMHVRYALEKASESDSCLSDADLRSADLSGADLSDACLSGADLRSADLREANLRSAYLSGADLRGANLSDACLSGADLSDACLSGADLRSAYLREANLRSAYLSGACLSGADLSDANLSSANLSGAYLSGAYLSGAYLSGEEKFSGDRPFFSVGPIGSRQDVFQAFTTDKGLRLKAGCFFGTLDEFRAKLINQHGVNVHREEYEAALVLIEKHAALWPAVATQEKNHEPSCRT